jgi:hypothetical protein
MHPHGTQQYEVEGQSKPMNAVQARETVVKPANARAAMPLLRFAPHPGGRLSGDHLETT